MAQEYCLVSAQGVEPFEARCSAKAACDATGRAINLSFGRMLNMPHIFGKQRSGYAQASNPIDKEKQ